MTSLEMEQQTMKRFIEEADDHVVAAARGCTRLLIRAIGMPVDNDFPQILWTSGKGEFPKPIEDSIRHWEGELDETFGSGVLYAVGLAPGLILGQEMGRYFQSLIILTPDGVIGRYGQAPGVEPGEHLTLRYPKIDEREVNGELTVAYTKRAIEGLTRRELTDKHAEGSPWPILYPGEHQCGRCKLIARTQKFCARDRCPNCQASEWQ